MWGKLEKLKGWVLEQVVWTEQHLKGKSGQEKRKAIVDKLDELIKLPFYLEWADGPFIGWLVDKFCDRLNYLTDYDFSGLAANMTESRARAIVESLDAPMSDVVVAVESTKPEDIDSRLQILCDEYGIDWNKDKAPEQVKQPETNQSKPAEIDWFSRCIAFTMKYEGGRNFTVLNGKPIIKGNAAADMGGATAYGITWGTLKAAHAQGIVDHDDICKLSEGEAQKIYRANYWNRYGWNELAWPVNLCCLDCCVNHGKFALILQRAINDVALKTLQVEVDGKFGPKTFAALKALNKNALTLALAIVARRREYFKSIVNNNPSQKVFLKGWLNRCNALEKEVNA